VTGDGQRQRQRDAAQLRCPLAGPTFDRHQLNGSNSDSYNNPELDFTFM
jgi:hypothetical protein